MNTKEERVIQWLEDQDEISLAVNIYVEDMLNECIVDTCNINYIAMLEYIGLLNDETPDGLMYWEKDYEQDVFDTWLNGRFWEFVNNF